MKKINILKSLVKKKLWIDDPEKIKPYLYEQRGNLRGSSPLLLKPSTSLEVSKILKICNKFKIPIIPQGGRTGLCGGTIPNKKGNQVLLTTEKMNKVIDIDKNNFSITVQSGCKLNFIKEAAKEINRFFPISLPSEGNCTIGGNIATNAGGSSVLRYGMTKDLIEGLEIVMPNGDIINGIKDIKKDNRSFDLQFLHIGSEGTLGIVTAAKLKLFPMIKNKAMAIVAFNNVENSINFLSLLKNSCFQYLSSYELTSNIGLNLIKKHFSNILIPFNNQYAWYVIFELSTYDNKDLNKEIVNIVNKAINTNIIVDALIPQNIKQYNNIWNTRNLLNEAQKINGPSIKHDISIPISKIPEFLKKAELKLSNFSKNNLLAFGHLADGNLHYNISKPYDMNNLDFKKLHKKFVTCNFWK